jgi:hypothetical protein
MSLAMLLPMTAALHGAALPILVVIGVILIIAGIVGLVRGSLVLGIVLIIIGILLGGLSVL